MIITPDEIRIAITNYVFDDSMYTVPDNYYDKMVDTWHDMNKGGHNWDHHKAAAALLYASYIDGYIHENQITPNGYKALDWAERFLQKFDTKAS